MTNILQLKIKLIGIKPPIWRRFLVEDSINFYQLHNIIQEVMGWKNYHLYEFFVNDMHILEPHEDYSGPIEDSKKIKLKEILFEKQKFGYIYDFGDSWDHIITIEKILEKDKQQKYPICIGGERACPPEDCGGTYGYEELLEIQKNKNHPEYEEMIVEWLGEDFDHNQLDIHLINKNLKKNL